MSKEKTKSTKEQVKELTESINALKVAMFDLEKDNDRRFNYIVEGMNRQGIVLEFHGHEVRTMTQSTRFLQDQYETEMKARQARAEAEAEADTEVKAKAEAEADTEVEIEIEVEADAKTEPPSAIEDKKE